MIIPRPFLFSSSASLLFHFQQVILNYLLTKPFWDYTRLVSILRSSLSVIRPRETCKSDSSVLCSFVSLKSESVGYRRCSRLFNFEINPWIRSKPNSASVACKRHQSFHHISRLDRLRNF